MWLLPLSLRNMSLLVLKLWGERTSETPRFWVASAMLSDLREGRPCWRTGWHSDHPENMGSEKRIQHPCCRIQRINRNPGSVCHQPLPPPQVMLVVKICQPMQEVQETSCIGSFHPWVRKISWSRKMAIYYSIRAWKIPQTEEHGGL